MEKPLVRIKDKSSLYYYVNGTRREGSKPSLSGYCTGLRGDCTDLRGDCTGLRGDCSLIPQSARPCDIAEWVQVEHDAKGVTE